MSKSSTLSSTNESRTRQTDYKMLKLGYWRVSTTNDEQTTSVEAQEKRLKANGCKDIYGDRLSGSDFTRPGLVAVKERALQAALSEPVELVVTSADRLGRDQMEWLALVGELEAAGVTIQALDTGIISVKDPENRMLWGVMSSVYEFQRQNTVRKIKKAKAERRANNRRLGGNTAFGYRWKKDNSQLEIDPVNGPIARELILKYIDGTGLISLEKWLKATYGIKFRSTSILGWLRNPVIKGHRRYRQVEGEKREEIHYGTHEPLITSSEIKALEYRVQNNQFAGPARTVRACSRLLRCESCRNRLRLKKCPRFGHQYQYFWCHGSGDTKCPHSGVIRYERVEPLILEAICKKAASIADAVLEPEQEQETPQALAKQAELAAYQQLHQQTPRPELQTLIDNVQREIVHLKSQHKQLKIDTEQLNELIVHLARPEFWEGLGEADRNQIYTELGVVVWCRGREIISIDVD